MKRTPTPGNGQASTVVTTHLSPARFRQLVAFVDRPEFVAPRPVEAKFWRDLAACMTAPGWDVFRALICFWPEAGADTQRTAARVVAVPQFLRHDAEVSAWPAQTEALRQRVRHAHLRLVEPPDGAQRRPAADAPATEGGAR